MEITATEINTRIAKLTAQRNAANDENVVATGRIAVLEERVRELEAEVIKLTPKKKTPVKKK